LVGGAAGGSNPTGPETGAVGEEGSGAVGVEVPPRAAVGPLAIRPRAASPSEDEWPRASTWIFPCLRVTPASHHDWFFGSWMPVLLMMIHRNIPRDDVGGDGEGRAALLRQDADGSQEALQDAAPATWHGREAVLQSRDGNPVERTRTVGDMSLERAASGRTYSPMKVTHSMSSRRMVHCVGQRKRTILKPQASIARLSER
jgi:hypothetical protein